MNWSTRKKSLRLSLTNLTKPSLKCRVTKPCNVTENSYAIIILSSTFEMSSKMSRRLKNLFVTFAKYFAMCQFTNRKVQLNIFSVHSFLNLISKPIERIVLVLELSSCTEHTALKRQHLRLLNLFLLII